MNPCAIFKGVNATDAPALYVRQKICSDLSHTPDLNIYLSSLVMVNKKLVTVPWYVFQAGTNIFLTETEVIVR